MVIDGASFVTFSLLSSVLVILRNRTVGREDSFTCLHAILMVWWVVLFVDLPRFSNLELQNTKYLEHCFWTWTRTSKVFVHEWIAYCRYNLCNCFDSGHSHRRLQVNSCRCKRDGFAHWYQSSSWCCYLWVEKQSVDDKHPRRNYSGNS